jgi:hypothetical protein
MSGGRLASGRTLRPEAIMNFDADNLLALRDVQEVRIRTENHPKIAVVIWIVVADDEVFVRSWLGTKGRWYRDLAAGGPATLEFGARRLAVQAIPASDPDTVARVSRELLRKYQPSSYFAPLAGLKLRPETELYLGLVHRDDMAGNAARLAAARSHVRVDGVATECGMARGDPTRFPELLAAHAKTAELASG